MDLSSFGKKDLTELKEIARFAQKQVNQRFDRIQRSDVIYSPAAEKLKASGGKISSNGTDVQKLKSEIARARSFLVLNTSSVRGSKQFEIDIRERTGVEFKNKAEGNRFWNLYNDFVDKNGGAEKVKSLYGSEALIKYTGKIYRNNTLNRTNKHQLIMEEAERLYAENNEAKIESDFSDEFFE